MIVLGIWLCMGRRQQRIHELFWIVYLAMLQTSIISATLPAAGAVVHYGFPDRADWLHDLEALRSGSSLHFMLPNMVGVEQFPSFHTVLAALVIYVARGTGVIGGLFIIWNLIMLVSIPTMGGHYLTDMIGGFVVVGVSIGLVRLKFAPSNAGLAPSGRESHLNSTSNNLS